MTRRRSRRCSRYFAAAATMCVIAVGCAATIPVWQRFLSSSSLFSLRTPSGDVRYRVVVPSSAVETATAATTTFANNSTAAAGGGSSFGRTGGVAVENDWQTPPRAPPLLLSPPPSTSSGMPTRPGGRSRKRYPRRRPGLYHRKFLTVVYEYDTLLLYPSDPLSLPQYAFRTCTRASHFTHYVKLIFPLSHRSAHRNAVRRLCRQL